ncbi:MAG: 1-acyl-sn-glycerol-3-phosphate acyltransferase [Saprospiraceae bacterium]|nr:1-acyl-sn-glycerol-3-phosphate acyltransferase [Saprospiraceae bacterium]
MLYSLVRPLAALAIRANYQHICISNTDRIPVDKPVILVANHPTAFMEPCILACFLGRPLYFLVRGDFFKQPFYNFLLRQLNMLPVFRMRDGGYRNLKNNYSTFEACFEALKDSKTIMILAEGNTIHEKRLRPIQKGTARIALGAFERFPDLEDVYVVPVGVNYTYAERSRTRVMIDFGEPLSARSYLEEGEIGSKSINQLTEDLTIALQERIVIIADPADEPLAEDLLRIQRPLLHLPTFPVINAAFEPLQKEKAITDEVNNTKAEAKTSWKLATTAFLQRLEDFKVSEFDVLGPKLAIVPTLLYLILGFVPFLLGYLWNLLPLGLARYIADNKVKDISFYTPVKWAVGIGAYLLWWIIWIVIFLTMSLFWAIPFLFVLTLFGYHAVYYEEAVKRLLESRTWERLSGKVKEDLKSQATQLLLGKF